MSNTFANEIHAKINACIADTDKADTDKADTDKALSCFELFELLMT